MEAGVQSEKKQATPSRKDLESIQQQIDEKMRALKERKLNGSLNLSALSGSQIYPGTQPPSPSSRNHVPTKEKLIKPTTKFNIGNNFGNSLIVPG